MPDPSGPEQPHPETRPFRILSADDPEDHAEWLHLWQLEATIDRLRGELEKVVLLGDLKSPYRRSRTAFSKASAALTSTGEPNA